MNILILAAGAGKRMQSAIPKVLHHLGGKPLLAHVVDTAMALAPTRLCVVYGYGGDAVLAAFSHLDIQFVLQASQLGTGHAVAQALPFIDEAAPTLILYGDVPLMTAASLHQLLNAAGHDKLAILTATLPCPTGYGRIVREHGKIVRIVEQCDASPEERALKEVNTGIMVIPPAKLGVWVRALSNNNAQHEYYLTDVIQHAIADGIAIVCVEPDEVSEALGVNSKIDLAKQERIYQRRVAQALLEQGVRLADPQRLDVRGTLHCGRDVSIDINCIFEGQVDIADGASIGAHCIIKNAQIGAQAQIEPFSHIDDSIIGAQARIGPYARLRPGTVLGRHVHIGNFVEVKNSQIAADSKANHLSYLGDATIGSGVNVGAGVITCNYDGANKQRTMIEDNAFIGSDSQLIAPVHIGKDATIGAGTTLIKDAPEGQLTLSRAQQLSRANWKRPIKR